MLSRRYLKPAQLVFSIVLLCVSPWPSQALVDAPAEVPPDTSIAGELERTLQSLALLSSRKPANLVSLLSFYQKRDYRPVWCNSAGISSSAKRWLSILASVEQEGLIGTGMHRAEIRQRLDSRQPAQLAELDLMLTDSFFQYARQMGQGQLDVSLIDPKWHIPQPEVEPVAVLEQVVQSGRVGDAVSRLVPRHRDYRKLRAALARYQLIEELGGWPLLQGSGPTLEVGSNGEEIQALREQLWLVGDLPENALQGTFYDPGLERAVRRFQRRHGLEVDGIVGRKSRAALATPVTRRVQQLRLNLERWRWLPRELGSRYIMVNSAAFELTLHDGSVMPRSMRVIVGRKRHPTPVFTEKMRYMIVNPYWHVPTRVAIRDLIPRQIRDPQYFMRKSIRVLSGWQAGAVELDPDQIDWPGYLNGGNYFTHKLRQDPGPGNALGRIKFMLPNTYAVYLHDTPVRHLFDKPVRTFSSGCVRVEKPLVLADFVLGGAADNSQPAVEEIIDQAATRTVPLVQPVPVYLLYQTAWVDGNGDVQFRDDIYGHDRKLAAALRRQTPTEKGGNYAGILSIVGAATFLH